MIRQKVLFIHNAVPEYRVEFWRRLSENVDLTLLITQHGVEEKIYDLRADTKGLSILYLDKVDNLEKFISNNDVVVLPPCDTPHEYLVIQRTKKCAKRYHIPCIYWCEKWEPDNKSQPLKKKIKNSVHRLMIKSSTKDCSAVIASGNKSRQYLTSIGVPEGKIKIAIDSSTSPEGSHLDIRERYSINPDAKIILYLGRLVHRKGCHILIEAMEPILQENVVLLICGEGFEDESLRSQARGFNNIIFTGKIQPSERRNYYEQSDFFVLPSVIEGGVIEAWGLTVNEALECGTPVIVTDAVGAAYDLINDVNGSIVKNNDVAALRKAICQNREKTFDRNEIKNLYRKFDVGHMAESFYSVINESHMETSYEKSSII